MAIGDELRKSFASDAATYNLGVQARQVGGNDAEALASVLTEKKLAAKPAAIRSSVNAANTGDISSGASALDVGNSNYVACYVDFDDAGGTASLALALFDAAGTPDFIGITEFASFQADTALRDGAAGPYVASRYIFDVSGASKVYPIVKALGTGNVVNIFLMAL